MTSRENFTPFDELLVGQYRTLIEQKATHGINYRDEVATTGSGSVTNDLETYIISTGSSPNSSATIRSTERAFYIAGMQAVAGLAVFREKKPVDGDDEYLWGYFDDVDGFGFGENTQGFFIFTLRNGVFKRIYQKDWNVDTLQGPNSVSGTKILLDITDPTVFRMPFIYYGAGPIEFRIYFSDKFGVGRYITVHRIAAKEARTVVRTPNLKLEVKATSSNGNDLSIRMVSRQFGIYGDVSTRNRLTHPRRIRQTIDTTGQTHVLTIRKRQLREYQTVPTDLINFSLNTELRALLEIKINMDLDFGSPDSWELPPGHRGANCAIEQTTQVDSFSGGDMIFVDSFSGGTFFSASADNSLPFDFEFPDDGTLTFLITPLVNNPNGEITLTARIREKW